MTTRNCVLGCTLTIALVLAGTIAAQADTLANIDFAAYSNAGLIGQDGWAAINNWGDLTVTNGTGATNTTGNNAGGAKSLSVRSLSSTDTLVETARFYSIHASDTVAGLVDGNQAGANWLPGVGIANNGSDGNARAYFRDVVADKYNEHYGDALTEGHTYDIRLTANLGVAGGLATVSYRDITAGQTEFTQDSSLVNVAMGLTQDSLGKYDFSGVALRISPYGTGISQFTATATAVPEPSTTALLLGSTIGMLAYAWHKRN